MRSRLYTSRELDYYGRERNIRIFRQIAGYFLLGSVQHGQCKITVRMSMANRLNFIEMILMTTEGKKIASSGRVSRTTMGDLITVVRPEDIFGAFEDLLRNALPDETRLVLLARASAGLHKEYSKDCLI